ncbi:hypothetical protein PV327_006782 [Microctonus hyperodae]|uniref:C2H2-type domain-containing protein n=1 Tax=Microctonus hyperodae TaxID=165561 RepID=A0AA39F508_MICHY|nr:hypothetical protein PV327_006782 [Microctonus hyperodae]
MQFNIIAENSHVPIIKSPRIKQLWRPFPCHTCGKSYTRKDTLRRHLRYECGKNPQYICYVCKKGFKQKSNFQRHNTNVHDCIYPFVIVVVVQGVHVTQKYPFTHEISQGTNHYRGGLNSNRQSSRSIGFIKPYPCYKCTRSYTNKSTLNRHLREECGKLPQYICRLCHKAFKQRSNFQRHIWTVHGSIL